MEVFKSSTVDCIWANMHKAPCRVGVGLRRGKRQGKLDVEELTLISFVGW